MLGPPRSWPPSRRDRAPRLPFRCPCSALAPVGPPALGPAGRRGGRPGRRRAAAPARARGRRRAARARAAAGARPGLVPVEVVVLGPAGRRGARARPVLVAAVEARGRIPRAVEAHRRGRRRRPAAGARPGRRRTVRGRARPSAYPPLSVQLPVLVAAAEMPGRPSRWLWSGRPAVEVRVLGPCSWPPSRRVVGYPGPSRRIGVAAAVQLPAVGPSVVGPSVLGPGGGRGARARAAVLGAPGRRAAAAWPPSVQVPVLSPGARRAARARPRAVAVVGLAAALRTAARCSSVAAVEPRVLGLVPVQLAVLGPWPPSSRACWAWCPLRWPCSAPAAAARLPVLVAAVEPSAVSPPGRRGVRGWRGRGRPVPARSAWRC